SDGPVASADVSRRDEIVVDRPSMPSDSVSSGGRVSVSTGAAPATEDRGAWSSGRHDDVVTYMIVLSCRYSGSKLGKVSTPCVARSSRASWNDSMSLRESAPVTRRTIAFVHLPRSLSSYADSTLTTALC